MLRSSGSFSLPAYAADGRQVQLHAEKQGDRAANAGSPAGDSPSMIQLQRD